MGNDGERKSPPAAGATQKAGNMPILFSNHILPIPPSTAASFTFQHPPALRQVSTTASTLATDKLSRPHGATNSENIPLVGVCLGILFLLMLLIFFTFMNTCARPFNLRSRLMRRRPRPSNPQQSTHPDQGQADKPRLAPPPPRSFAIDAARAADGCPVCLEKLSDAPVAQCARHHAAHAVCLGTWLAKASTCPMCRAPFRDGAPGADMEVDIEDSVELTSSDVLCER